jgi:hypothetical protein
LGLSRGRGGVSPARLWRDPGADGTTSAAATPTLTSGTLASGDTATYSETYSTKDAGTGNKTLTPAVTIKDSGNVDVTASYSITLNSISTGTINPKALTALGTLVFPVSKVYDGTTTATPSSGAAALQGAEVPAAGTTSDGKPYSVDSVRLTGTASYNHNSKDVASATTITESGLSLTGTGNGNYTLTPPSFGATITVASTTSAVTSSANPALPGSNLVFTSTLSVTAPGGGIPSGSVLGPGIDQRPPVE